MKIIIAILLIILPFLEHNLTRSITLIISLLWLISTIINYIKVYKGNDKKINTSKYLTNMPNTNESCYIRYLYSGKIDEKVFISSIFELILNKEISVVKEDNEYYLIDSKNNCNLTKNEEFIKKILFNDIAKKTKISIKEINNAFKKSSGYMYKVYNDWVHTFTFDVAKFKYYKSTKSIKDELIFYFVLSFIIAIYNLLFTHILLFIFIFAVTSYLIYMVNNYVNREEEAIEELTRWIKLKNYIKKEDNELDKLDTMSLEKYALYSYVLDCKNEFIDVLKRCDDKIINSSELLMLMKIRGFDIIEDEIIDGIKTSKFNVIVLFKKNKGRL